MTRAVVLVAIYSTVLIGLFTVFSYLMYIVEPEKVYKKADTSDNMSDTTESIINESENSLFALINRRRKQGHSLNVPRRLIVSRKHGNATYGTINDLESIADLNKPVSWEHSAGYRRSVDFHKPINFSESIILRVLDDDGYPRIEIKINNKDIEKVSESMLQNSSKFKVNLDSVEMKDIDSFSNKSELQLLP